MEVTTYGRPNLQRFAETWAALIAAREGLEVVPGSVKVELRSRSAEVANEQTGKAVRE